MDKLDNKAINYIKLFSIDMIKEAKENNYLDNYYASSILYSLYMNNLIFDYNNNYANRDRIVISDTFLPSIYSTLNLFGFNISLDNLKEYKKFGSITSGNPKNVDGIDICSNKENIASIALGFSLGRKYLDSLIKKELPKCNLINFNTYVLCKYEDLIIGSNLEALNYINKNKIKNICFIVLNDSKNKLDKTLDMLDFLDFKVIDGDINNVDKLLNDVKNSKTSSIIFVTPKDKEKLSFDEDNINNLKTKYKIEDPYNINNTLYNDIKNKVSKRLEKSLNKWNTIKDGSNKEIVNKVINFLNNKDVNINYNIDNIKINDNYEEELLNGNNKILNLVASKSPFIINLSNNFKCNNININDDKSFEFNNNIVTLGGVSVGLASLGFKVFVSLPLYYSNYIYNTLNVAIKEELPITYIFTHDSFLSIYNSNSTTYELNSLRLIPDLFNFRPADINEIIGVYAIVSKLNKPCTIILGNEKVNKLIGTNPKYVIAGAYRVKRERGEAGGVLMASGTEVAVALKLAEELLNYDIDLRVVSIPSKELFEHQSERYKYTLLPYDLKTFVLEFSNTNIWQGYTKNPKYILGVDKYSSNGTKEELLNYYNLDMDSLKTRIIELMKEE